MADIALKTANRVEVVESIIQHTAPAAEAITAGAPVRLDTASGNWTNANATSAAEARVYGLACRTVVAGEALTAIRKGVFEGFDLSGLAFDAAVHLSNTDGRLADAAGTTAAVVGRVISGCANLIGAAHDKLLFVDL